MLVRFCMVYNVAGLLVSASVDPNWRIVSPGFSLEIFFGGKIWTTYFLPIFQS